MPGSSKEINRSMCLDGQEAGVTRDTKARTLIIWVSVWGQHRWLLELSQLLARPIKEAYARKEE